MEEFLNMPDFDKSKCNGCGLCVDVCTCHSFLFIETILHMIKTAECDSCQQCEIVCPTGAISFSFEIIDEE